MVRMEYAIVPITVKRNGIDVTAVEQVQPNGIMASFIPMQTMQNVNTHAIGRENLILPQRSDRSLRSSARFNTQIEICILPMREEASSGPVV